ncbi:hypothetical protein [Altererythrobacter sp. MTPC7]|uniref:hypothetical protein n=1 Tax=Altererythrobacter sp. MTPC7 TaxID=3056567 RepID=UPI0036F44201
MKCPFVLVAVGLSLAGCGPQDASLRPENELQDIAKNAEPVPDLQGHWTVSRLDGETLDMRIPLSGSSDTLAWDPGCAGWILSYRAEEGRLVIADDVVPRDRPVCDIGYPEPLPAVMTALQGRWTATKEPNGNIVLLRDETRLVLEASSSTPPETLAGEWDVVQIDGRPAIPSGSLRITADAHAIRVEPSCLGGAVPYRIVNERFSVIETPAPPPPPPGAEPVPPPPVCAVVPPKGRNTILSIIGKAEKITRGAERKVTLSGSGGSLTLARRAAVRTPGAGTRQSLPNRE